MESFEKEELDFAKLYITRALLNWDYLEFINEGTLLPEDPTIVEISFKIGKFLGKIEQLLA